MLSENIGVHVVTKEQYREVLRYYNEKKGWHTAAMTEDHIAKYPYLHLWNRSKGVITGRSMPLDEVLSFEEWQSEISGKLAPFEPDLKLLFGGDDE